MSENSEFQHDEQNLHPMGSVCPVCGKKVSRGETFCADCENDRNKDGGIDMISGLPNWCRLTDCDYDCNNCEKWKKEQEQ